MLFVYMFQFLLLLWATPPWCGPKGGCLPSCKAFECQGRIWTGRAKMTITYEKIQDNSDVEWAVHNEDKSKKIDINTAAKWK